MKSKPITIGLIVFTALAILGVGGGIIAAVALETTKSGTPVLNYPKNVYEAARQQLIDKDLRRALGANLVLNEQERKLNKILLEEKNEIEHRSRCGRTDYKPALSFFKSKGWMNTTKTFRIIRKMPKGAALHLHEPAIASLHWLVKDATYRNYVYMCQKNGVPHLLASSQPPHDTDECSWSLVNEVRSQAQYAARFDEELRQNLSMLTTDPLIMYPSINKVWDRFNTYFDQVIPLIFYIPVLKDYLRQALKEFYEDNIQYVEIRGGMAGYTHPDGSFCDYECGVSLFKEVFDGFAQDHQDFSGGGVIMSGLRMKEVEEIEKEVRASMSLRQKYPEFFLGYDLVAQEDPLKSLYYYAPALLLPSDSDGRTSLPYFFHAGETKWQGTEVDENIVDALLLNTTRLGHAYALAKHPELADEVKRRGIPVEVNPISNQLLGLVSDMRNHALTPLIADNFPLVISSDDPATWEALPLTHDYFVAYMDMSNQHIGLAFLKQLAMNSIKYSAMSDERKGKAMELWQSKWDKFVDEALAEFQ